MGEIKTIQDSKIAHYEGSTLPGPDTRQEPAKIRFPEAMYTHAHSIRIFDIHSISAIYRLSTRQEATPKYHETCSRADLTVFRLKPLDICMGQGGSARLHVSRLSGSAALEISGFPGQVTFPECDWIGLLHFR